jgi:Do/DeqQ family serine protease
MESFIKNDPAWLGKKGMPMMSLSLGQKKVGGDFISSCGLPAACYALENRGEARSFLRNHIAMLLAIKRFSIFGLVFLTCFLGVFALRTWRSGAEFSQYFPSFFADQKASRPEKFTPSEKAPLQFSDVEIISRINEEYARLTKAVVPAVVSINTTGIREERRTDFMGRATVQSYPTQGMGSGVIVSKEGHIITNHHVIAGQNKIRVTLHGGKTYDANLIGEDPLLDIAVIKIESSETFTPLKLGDSSKVEVGQLVFAVGNPFGLGETVTQGIISAKERSLSDNQRDLFQTDAAINPGNSGGPLVNLTGEVIGINVAIFSVNRSNPSFQGVGFSIPSNEVRDALEQIISRGRPIRGYLGVEMRDIDFSIRASTGYELEAGSFVLGTKPKSPAEKAGLLAGDIIITYDGNPVTGTTQLISLVQRSKIGKTIAVGVWRNGELIELRASIAEANTAPVYQEALSQPNATLAKIGIEVRDLNESERSMGYHGVMATGVSNGLAAHSIRQGDLILAINKDWVNSAAEFYQKLSTATAQQAISIAIVRDGIPLILTLPPFSK